MQDLLEKLTKFSLPIIENQVANKESSVLDDPIAQSLWTRISPLLSNPIEDLKESPDDESLLQDLPVLVKNDLKRAVKRDTSLQEELEGLVIKMETLNKVGDAKIEDSKNIVLGSNIKAGGNLHIGDIDNSNVFSIGEIRDSSVTNINKVDGDIHIPGLKRKNK